MTTNICFQYFDSGDPERLRPYFELRRRAYLLEYPWLPPSFGAPDDVDRISRIVVAVRSGSVVGGARLTLSTPQNRRPLPLEEAGFSLRECSGLAPLHLELLPYGEVSRMAVDPGMSEGLELSRGLTSTCCELAAAEGADAVFGICPEGPARLNRTNARRLGLRFETFGELATVFGRKMTLCAFVGLQRRYAGPERGAA